MRNSKVRKLTVSAIMLALSIVLSFVTIYRFPLGGAVTFFSMLPVCMVGIMYGLPWGLGTAFCYSIFQLFTSEVFTWGLTPTMLIASILLDYVLAFTVLGFSGIFRKKGRWGALAGILLVCVLRFLIHFVSGIVLWAKIDEFVVFGSTFINRPVLYSLCYNGAYMLPECIMTVIGAAIFLNGKRIGAFVRAGG